MIVIKMKYTEEQLRESEDRARVELNRIGNHIEKFFNNNMPGIIMNLRKAENVKEIMDSFQGKTITPEIKKLIENRIQELLLDEWLKINTPEIEVNIDLDYGDTHIDVEVIKKKNTFSKRAKQLIRI
jgi:nitrogenase subunit NifH